MQPRKVALQDPPFVRRFQAETAERPEELVALACDENYLVRRRALTNPSTPEWVLDLLHRAGATSGLRGIGPATDEISSGELRRLVECGTWAQQIVARHPNADDEVLGILAAVANASVRLAVAGNPSCPEHVLASLAADEDETIRRSARLNPDTPEGVVELLISAGSTDDLVSLQPRSPRLPLSEVKELAALGFWGQLLACRMQACPAELVTLAVSSDSWQMRSAALDHNLTGPAELGQLGTGESREVRLAIARHPETPSSVLTELASDGERVIRRQVTLHPNRNHDIINQLTHAGSSKDLMRLAPPPVDTAPGVLAELAGQGSWGKQLAVRHPNTPPDTLAKLLCDSDPKTREWAAAHPGAPRDVIQLLRRAGCSSDYQGVVPCDPAITSSELAKVAAFGPWGEILVAEAKPTNASVLDGSLN